MTCVFCREPSDAGEVLFEGAPGWVILHDDWSVRGHVMVVARQHVENPADLPADEWLQFAVLWHRAETALLQLTGRERIVAIKLGIQTPHLHIHLYPFAGTATREEVFAAIDGRTTVARDHDFVEGLRHAFGSFAPHP